MMAKATESDKAVLRTVMDKLVASKKPMGPELAEQARQWLRSARPETTVSKPTEDQPQKGP